jgi:tripartite-type tricarboxylate transporter receptor subunit TctC
MPLPKLAIALCAGLMGLVAFATTPLSAQSDFYSGKTILLYVGFSPGGGVDSEARIAARHLARFIPGNPTIVVKNMPGAGGIVLANHIYKGAEADGLTLAMPGRSGFLLSNIVKDKNVTYDPMTLPSSLISAARAAPTASSGCAKIPESPTPRS